MSVESPTPLLALVAYSGTGKTTLLEQLLPWLAARGIRVATVKHTHHQFDIDKPGKDSYRLRVAGARQVLVASRRRWALITELDETRDEPDLQQLLQALDHDSLDLVLVEGFKHEDAPKLELHRPVLGKPLLCTDDANIVAVASDDATLVLPRTLPLLDLNDIDTIGHFVLQHMQTHKY